MTRSRSLTTAVAASGTLAFCGTAPGAVILQYQGGQAGPQTENFASGGDITAGSDASVTVNSTVGSYPSAPVIQLDPNSGSSNPSDAVDSGRFFSFTLTVNANVVDLDLDEFNLLAARGGSSQRDMGIFYQVNGSPSTVSSSAIVANENLGTQRSTFTSYDYDLTGFGDLQNLIAGDVVTFYISEDNAFTIETDNITVEGTGVIPEPASLALLGLGGLCLLPRRRR
jgi:hypothetical protein